MLALIIIIIFVVVQLITADEFNKIAAEKGYQGSKYFWYCLLFGIAGWMMVSALPDRKNRYHENGNTQDSDRQNQTKVSESGYMGETIIDDLPDL